MKSDWIQTEWPTDYIGIQCGHRFQPVPQGDGYYYLYVETTGAETFLDHPPTATDLQAFAESLR